MINAKQKKTIATLVLGAQLCMQSWAGNSALIVENAWSPSAPPGMMMHAGYLVIKNVSEESMEITGFSSPYYQSVSLHDTVTEDGIHKMIEIEHPRLEPQGTIAMVPGGKHLMLMGPSQPQKESSEIPIIIELNNGESIPVSLVIKQR